MTPIQIRSEALSARRMAADVLAGVALAAAFALALVAVTIWSYGDP